MRSIEMRSLLIFMLAAMGVIALAQVEYVAQPRKVLAQSTPDEPLQGMDTKSPDGGKVDPSGESNDAPGGSDQPPPPPQFLVLGRTIRTERFPLEGANIVVRDRSGIVGRGRSSADGAFSVGCTQPTGAIEVSLNSGQLWRRIVRDLPAGKRLELGSVLLVSARDLAVTVSDKDGRIASALVHVSHKNFRAPIPLVQRETDRDGRLLLKGVPRGELVVVASARGRAPTTVGVPANANSVSVVLGDECQLVVCVRDETSREPVAGATFVVRELLEVDGAKTTLPICGLPPIPETDRNGITRILGLKLGTNIELRDAKAPSYPLQWTIVDRAPLVSVTESRARLDATIAGPRTVRWPIQIDGAGDAEPPRDGDQVQLLEVTRGSVVSTSAVGRIESGLLVVEGLPRRFVRLLAYVGEAVAELSLVKGKVEGTPVSFYKQRSATVSVRDSAGEPVPNVGISIRLLGAHRVSPVVVTGDSGAARFPRLWCGRPTRRAVVECAPFYPSSDGNRVVARLDLQVVSHKVRVVLPSEETFVLRIRVDGVARLPTSYALFGPGVFGVPVSENPERGEVRLRARRMSPKSKIVVRVFAGRMSATAEEERGELTADLRSER